MNITRKHLLAITEWGCLALLMLSVLIRGGKGLEATWALAGAALVLTFARWARAWSSKIKMISVPPHTWIALMAFVGWSALSFLFSTTQNYGLDELLRDGALALLFLWGVSVMQQKDVKDPTSFSSRFIAILCMAALVACVMGVLVYVLQPVNRFVGTFFDWRFHTDYWPNAWAEFLLLVWPMMILWLRGSPWAVRILTFGLTIGCLLLSYSRGSFIVFCGQIALFAAFLLHRSLTSSGGIRSAWKRHRTMIAAAAGTLVLSIVVFHGVNAMRATQYEVESVSAKATFTASEGSSSISERKDFWKQSFALSLQKPLFGWGPYSFRFIQPRLQETVFGTSDHPHNVFLKLAMERGWPAALLYAFVIGAILWSACRRELRTPSARLPAIVAVAGVLAHNLIDYNLQFTAIAMPLWLLLAFIAPERTLQKNDKRVARVVEVALATILACVAILEGRMLLLSSFGRHAEARGDVPEALMWYDRAQNEVFSRDMHLTRGALLLQRGDLDGAAGAFRLSESQNPEDARLWILLGNLASMRDDADTALADYAKAIELGKYNYLEPLEGVLRILESGVHPEIAADRRDDFRSVINAFGEAILRNIHFIALSESVETFDRVTALYRKVYPATSQDLEPFARSVLDHAQEERSRSASRNPGLLW